MLVFALSVKRSPDFENLVMPHLRPSDNEIELDVDPYDIAIQMTSEDGRSVTRRVG